MKREKHHLLRQLLRKAKYWMHMTIYRSKNLKVYSIGETVDRIVEGNCSVVRFGDGEMYIIEGKGIGFQAFDTSLRNKLLDVMKADEDDFLVCIPDIFERLDKYSTEAKTYWQKNLYMTRKSWEKHFSNDKTYYNAFLSRPYMDLKDKKMSGEWFQKIKRIWSGRDVVLIEGRESRLGLHNDLFLGARSVERILCPAKNAFAKYDEILVEAMKTDKRKLILVSLGPAAKPLVYDLHKQGYQAVDIGHIDIEYEWFLRGAKKKIPIENKFVNEVNENEMVGHCPDEAYQKQIIAVIV